MSDPAPDGALQPTARRVTSTPGISITGVLVPVALVVAAATATTIVSWSSWGLGAPVMIASAFGVVAIVLGVVVQRPERVISWSLLAVGSGLHLAATVALVVRASDRPPDTPGLSDAIASLAYPALFVGIAGITTRRRNSWCTDGPTAACAVFVLTAVVALAVTLPQVDDGGWPVTESQWAGVLATCDLLLAAMVARRVVGSAQRSWSSWLLLAGFVIWGNGHAEVGVRLFDQSYTNRSVVVLALGLGPILVGLGALVPSMADVPPARHRGERGEALVSTLRWAAVPAVVLALSYATRIDPARLWVLAPSLVVIVSVAGWTARRAAELGEVGADPW